MKNKLILIAAFFIQNLLFGQNITVNITDFGAIGDAKTLNTESIQRTIDTCAAQGGGQVIVPQGTFLSGSIRLKTGVELHLTEGGVLLGSAEHKDYKNDNRNSWYAFIMANNQNRIAITGKGTIDGQGRVLVQDIIRLWRAGAFPGAQVWDERLKEKNRPNERFRPQLIFFQECKNVIIDGINLQNGTSWIQTYEACEDVIIRNICVESTAYWNNDGIDIVDCKNVLIRDCFVNSADDAICLKSFDRNSRCENISIENCTMRSSASALKLGTSSYGGFSNIKAKNLTIYDTYRSAIALECVDGGVMENINISHVKAMNTGNAIFINLGHRIKERPIGKIDNIRIHDMVVEVPNIKPDKGYEMEGPLDTLEYNILPSSIVGLPNYFIKNIILKKIIITYKGGGTPEKAYIPIDSLQKVPEKACVYPEFSMFGELPAWGFFVRHCMGMVFENVELRLINKDYRPAFVFDDVNNLHLAKIRIPTGGSLPTIILKDVQNATFKKIFTPKSSIRKYLTIQKNHKKLTD